MIKSAALFALTFSVTNAAAAVLYDNGPINGMQNGYNISIAGAVGSNSFIVSASATLETVDIGTWVLSRNIPLTVDWKIGTSYFDNSVASGTSNLTNTYFGAPLGTFDVYSSTFSLPNIKLAPGVYYLTLLNATSLTGNAIVAWDVNSGPSSNRHSYGYNVGSNSFRLTGTVPEPGTYALWLVGVIVIGTVRRRFYSGHVRVRTVQISIPS